MKLPREEQILLLVYCRERDQEEFDRSVELAPLNLLPLGGVKRG